MNSLLDAALAYASRGWFVLPLVPRDKTPITRFGVHDARTDSHVIRSWWTKNPQANIGIDCGRSGLVVIDVDLKTDGVETWTEGLGQPIEPGTLTVRTGTGGWHYYFRAPEGIEIHNSVGRLGPGLDVRAQGGYVVAPPSVHPCGVAYCWADHEYPIVPLPDWLVERLNVPTFERSNLTAPQGIKVSTSYARAALEGEVAAMAEAKEGTRNNILYFCAFKLGTLVGAGALKKEEVEAQLTQAAHSAGLDDREIARTLASGLRDGIARPRSVRVKEAERLTAEHAENAERSEYKNVTGQAATDSSNISAGSALSAVSSSPASSCPPLPAYAQLSDAQRAAGEKAGRWLDEYVAFGEEASKRTPRAFHVAAGLFLGALAIARRLHIAVSTDEHSIYPNLFILFVGPSTIQAKTTAERVMRGVISRAGMDYFLLADRQTPEALAGDLTTRMPKDFQEQPEEVQAAWLEERAIAAQRGWLLSEASHLLDSFNRDYTSGLLPMVLDLYDANEAGSRKNTVSRGLEGVKRPYLSIFGTTTYSALGGHLRLAAHWNNGLWARFALVASPGGEWSFWPPRVEYPPSVIDPLRRLSRGLLVLPTARYDTREVEDDDGEKKKRRTVRVEPELKSTAVTIAAEAWAQWEKYNRALTRDLLPESGGPVPERLYASYGRLDTTAAKVATILAALDAERLPVRMEGAHFYRAQTIVEDWRANLHLVLDRAQEVGAEDAGNRLAASILGVLEGAGGEWVTRRELLRKMHKTWSQIQATIGDLHESGRIEREESKSGKGPAGERYRAAC